MLDGAISPDEVVRMKVLSKRELTRRPAILNTLAPGDMARIADRKGDLVIVRQKATRLTAEQMAAQLDALAPGCPALDVDKILAED